MVYTNSKLVSYTKLSPNKNVPRKNATYNPSGAITKITIHHMAGNLSVETLGNMWANTARQCSSNYGIGSDGRVGLYVEEKDRSWCSSSPANDFNAITIEVANDVYGGDWHVSDTAYNKLIDLCVDICQRNDIPILRYTGGADGSLTIHSMFTATACPGPYLKGKLSEIVSKVNVRLSTPQPEPTPPTSLKVGDKVKLLSTATTYATGQNIPDWVKENTYWVKEKAPDKSLLGAKDSAGINSWLLDKDLVLVTSAPVEEAKVYTVQPGDSWWKIADEQMGDGTRYEELAKYNGMTSKTVIHPGMTLQIPV